VKVPKVRGSGMGFVRGQHSGRLLVWDPIHAQMYGRAGTLYLSADLYQAPDCVHLPVPWRAAASCLGPAEPQDCLQCLLVSAHMCACVHAL